MVVALSALFVAVSGAATAATPTVQRALSARAAISVASAPFRVPPDGRDEFAVSCGGGKRAISGGWTTIGGGAALVVQNYPASKTTWRFQLVNQRSDGPAVGTIYAVCFR
jgi:hypothetical protein